MADTATTVPFINGNALLAEQLSLTDGNGNVVPQTALRANSNPVSTTNPLPVSMALAYAGYGNDASSSPPTILTTLKSGTVVNPGQLYVQNQSNAVIQIILNPAAVSPAAPTIILLNPGASPNGQGGEWQAAISMPWFTGSFIIAGPAGSQVGANSN